MLISIDEQKKINEIQVNEPVFEKCAGDIKRVCDPEDFFDVIEQCKICGRCA
ncbi:hypothetical protein [Flavobacterium johnsoniae]|uniref:Uncharacterized protein n=1 Tax=Flavobacterium johnsoniae TaxID=986 RepID=A0A1M5IKN0_FLAJO|nr:hypothetical protein [Flavobacterium johnsoniae]SHG28480.1 hypothetical protein SAMN05444388_102131 [Flavobacterium johnsoniae]